MTHKFVEFEMAGAFFAETERIDVDDFPSPRKINWPGYAFAAKFYEQTIIESNGESLRGTPKQVGKRVFRQGAVVCRSEHEASNAGGGDILISNMAINGYPAVVKTNLGNWQPFDDASDMVA